MARMNDMNDSDTYATLHEVAAHAGRGSLPERIRTGYFASDSIELGTASGRRWELLDSEARDLCVGHWVRRLHERGYGLEFLTYEGSLFTQIAEEILTMPADAARRMFTRKET